MLRVIGLLFVVAYHLYPSALRGGFIGVDIFFVCSGYLMTAHIINEYGAKSRVKLAASYTRRFKRLFPALAGAVLFGMALSLFISPDFRVDIGRQALAAAAAFTNYYEILTGGSYENQLLPHLFVHTWALAVEIQFYAVWGAILAAVVWLNRKSPDRGRAAKTAFAAALVLGALSYLVMRLYYSGGGDPARAYYAFESRAFSLLAGAAAGAIAGASAPRRQKESAPRRRFVPAACAAAALSVAGLAVLAVRLRYNEPETYSFGLLLAAALAAAAIAAARAADVPNLRGRPLGVVSYLSSRSYGVYLYHWPLLVAVRQLLPVRAAVAPAVLLLSFLAAEASYRLIERPLRYFSFSRNKRPANAGQKRMASFRLAASTLAMILLTASAYSIASAPQKTSIQLDLEAEAGLAASIMAKAQDGAAQPPESEKMSADKSNADKPGADSPDADMSAANDGIASGPAISSVPDAGGQDRLLPQRTEDSGALAETPPASPKSVLVVGDSVTLGASSAILETIPGSVVDAAESRDIRAGLTLLADYAEKGTLGDVIVVSLADNNLNRKTDERLLEVIRTYAADRKVVLVTGYGNADMQPVADFIRTLPEAYPNVAVADWAEAVALHTDWLYSDNTHIKSRDGKQLYADLIAEAIGRLEKTETG